MIAFAYYVALGVILVFSHGMQNDGQTLGLVALQLVFSGLAIARPKARPFASLGVGAQEGLLGAALVLFSLFLAHGHEMLYAQKSESLTRLIDLLHWLPVAAAVLLGAVQLERGRVRTVAFWAAAAMALVILVYTRVLVLVTSPHPFIDVWTSSQRAVEYFLDGQNPYTGNYKDIYGGQYDYFPSFPYLPAYLYWATLGFLVFKKAHDVRVSLLAAELLVAVCLGGFARKQGHKTSTSVLVALVWLAFPVDLFILEQGWIDALLLAGFAAAIWALVEERLVLCGIFLGIACSTKQYAVLGVSFWLLYVWRTHGVRGLIRVGGAMCLTALVFMGPFAALNFRQFCKYTLMSWGGALPRVDSLSLPAYLAHQSPPHGDDALRAFYTPFQIASYATWGGLLVWLGRKKRPTLPETLGATAAVTGVLLVIAKQSFCNYYYFLSFFVLLVVLVAPAEEPSARVSDGEAEPAASSTPPRTSAPDLSNSSEPSPPKSSPTANPAETT